MEDYVQSLRIFHYPAAFAAGRALSTEIAQPDDVDKIGMELLCLNPQNEERDLALKFWCYQLSGSQAKAVWYFEDKVSLRKDQPESRFDRHCSKILDIGNYRGEIFLEGRYAGQYNFQITESAPAQVPVEVSQINLYEGAEPGHFDLSRQFSTKFDVARTRFVCVECSISLRHGSAHEVGLSDILEFHFKNYQGKTVALDRRPFSISAQSYSVQVRGGCGHVKKGNWQAGMYELWVVFQGKLLQRFGFDCYHQEQVLPKNAAAERNKQTSINYIDLDPFQLVRYPDEIEDQLAVVLAYKEELDKIADYIQHGLSVLISCDKNLVEYLYEYIYTKSGKTPLTDHAYDTELFQKQLTSLNKERILVIRSLDLLDSSLGAFILYHTLAGQNAQILAFVDLSANLNNTALINRFHVRTSVTGLPKRIFEDWVEPSEASQAPGLDIFEFIVTKSEKACFKEEDDEKKREFGAAMHKQVASLNALQFRRAMQYIGSTFSKPTPYRDIFREIRHFKTNLIGDGDISIPETSFEDIGGYNNIKAELLRMLNFMADQKGQKKKAPKFKGFIFHGPPGTGKTLFAKAIANELNATIQMISGPEIVDKWVGQSEANLRRVFNLARRNAPSVILFDEFDSIARKRTQGDDGGARAGNSLMAQLLTELDGFREDDGVLVIGTTNQLELIDTALLRPSRLTPIKIDLPDTEARKRVAEIHAEESGAKALAIDTFKLVLKHLGQWDGQSDIPEGFLRAFYEINPIAEKHLQQEAEIAKFQADLREFRAFVKKMGEQFQAQNDAALQQVLEQVVAMGKRYNLKFEETDSRGNTDSSAVAEPTSMQRDLLSLFQLVDSIKEAKGEVSAETYLSTLMNLVAEYTDGFNNDEIRAVFQDISIDSRSKGQVITPRYVGQKIGLVQKRKSEKSSKL